MPCYESLAAIFTPLYCLLVGLFHKATILLINTNRSEQTAKWGQGTLYRDHCSITNQLTCTLSHRQAIQILILLTLAGMERKCKGPGVQQCEAAVLTTATPCHTTIRSIINKNNQFWDLLCHIAIDFIWQRQQQSLQEQLTVSMETRNAVFSFGERICYNKCTWAHSWSPQFSWPWWMIQTVIVPMVLSFTLVPMKPVTLCGCRHSPLQNSCW